MAKWNYEQYTLALCSGVSVAALLIAAPALAQEVEVEAEEPVVEEGEAETERMLVTGSRIATQDPTTTTSPVLSIGADEIKRSGENDITFLLRESPALQGSLPGSFSAFTVGDTEDSDLGIGLLNLRSLGIERTLVLQDGRRHVAGTAGQAAVDVNTIPISLLDRIDVLTGGASSIYGADAVTGVVNFILRDGASFDGFEIRAQGGITDNGDAEEAFLSLANGFEYDGGKGSAVFSIEYTRTTAVFGSDRDFAGSGFASAIPVNDEIAAAFGINPAADNTFVANRTLPVSSPLGIISILNGNDPTQAGFAGFALGLLPGDGSIPNTPLNDGTPSGVPQYQVVDGGVLRPYNSADIFVGLFAGVGGDAVPTNPDVELILPETDRVVFNTNTSYELHEYVNFFVEAKFAFTDSFDSVQVNGFNDDIPILPDNPFIPAELQGQLDQLIAAGVDPILAVSRDTLDTIVLPTVNAERTTFRIVGGFEGELPFGLDYELSYNYGRTQVDVINANTRLEDRFFASIDAVVDPATGEIVCRSDLDPTAEPPLPGFPTPPGGFSTFQPGDGTCAPTSIFGADAINPEAAAFAFVTTTDSTVLTQEAILATVSGDTSEFFELPFGPIGFAAGFEYRSESSDFRPDPLDTAGLTFGAVSSGPTLPSSGEVDVYEGFIEGRIPLLADLPFIELVEFSGSARFSDYDTIGRTTAWTVGGRYIPVEWLTFRGTFSTAVRAPNIGELFSPQQPATLGADDDPCNPEEIGNGTEFRVANCLALVGEGFDSTDFNTAFVPGLSGGNPNLEEETAETITAGFVFQPGGRLAGLTVIADYYDIQIEGAIDSLDAFDIAEACVDLPSLANQFCDQIFRDPVNGNITGFVSGQINLGALETSGVDWNVRYEFEVPTFGGFSDLGFLSINAVGTRFLENEEFQDPTDPSVSEDLLGEFAIPKWIVNFNANWFVGKFNFGWNGRFESNQLLNDDSLSNEAIEANPLAFDPFESGSAFVHDFTAGYDLRDSFRIYGGINNAFDRDPFIGTLSRPAGPRGRFFFLGIQATI